MNSMAQNRGGGRSRKKPIEQITIAKERIDILFSEARGMMKSGIKDKIAFANRYVQLARKIAMRYNIKLPTAYRRMVCKYCKRYLYPGITSQTRVKNGKVNIKCMQCGKTMHYGLKKE